MIIYFTDRHINIIGLASTELPDGLIATDDKTTEDVETGVSIFECKIPYDKKTRGKVTECTEVGNHILYNRDGESKLYTIIDAEIDTKRQEIYIYAEDDGMDLLNEVVGAYEADKAYAIDHYINMYAADAGFEIGINEAKGLTRKLSWDGESTATARIASVATQFDGCEISFSFTVDRLNVVKKYINIYKERGKDIGVTLRLNQGIDSIVTTKSIANLATALQAVGGTPEDENIDDDVEPEAITLKGYKYDDGDFYVDTDGILKSRNALKRWSRLLWKTDNSSKSGGHIVKQYSYDTLSQKELCSRTVTELKKICDMEVNYKVDLKRLPDNVKIGDRVNIVDDAGGLYLSSRILLLEISDTDQEYKATIGEHLIKGSGIHQKVADLAAQFAKNSKSAARALAIANNAKAAAGNAQAQADTALSNADNAQQAAIAAQTAANSAGETALQAQEKAAAAQAAVDTVEKSVKSLETTVTNAQAAAEQAQQAADTADAKAVEAQQAAVNAQAKADEAAAAAGAAQEKADSATTKADTATSTAEQAIADAEAAATTAAAAKLDAENAQKDIDSLGENLTTLENTMSADYARKTDLTEATASLQTQITQNADQITSTATKVQKIDETANNAAEKAEAAQTAAGAAQAQADQAQADAQAAQTAADAAAAAATAAQGEADTAKAAAATAKSVADKAEADLAAAKADLETVTERVDATEEEITAAQQAVAAAQSAADNAQAEATAAAKKATDAQSTADTAAANAASAQTAANDAASAAALAQQTADAAKGDATAAQQAADEAAAAAAEAQRTANTAASNATAAQTKANEAAQAAATAQQAADDADAKAAQAAADLATAEQNLADVTNRVGATEEEVAAAQQAVTTAQAAADKAKEDAKAAQATADTAKANAATAQSAANTAKAAADKAQADATAAQKAADDAQADVDALAVRVTSAETRIEQNAEQIALRATKTEVAQTLGGYSTKEETAAAIQLKADEINSTVSNTYATKQAVEDIEVGGRNYIKGGKGNKQEGFFSKFSTISGDGYCEHTLTSQKTYSNVDLKDGFVLGCRDYEVGRQVTMSYDFMYTAWDFPEGSNRNEFWIGQRYTNSSDAEAEGKWRAVTRHTLPVVGENGCELNKWVHIERTMTIPEQADESIGEAASIQFYNSNADVAASITFRLRNVKLEYGNKATDWTEAPEDVADNISEAQNTADNANESVAAAQSAIQQLADSISALVRDENGGTLVKQDTEGLYYFDISGIEAGLSATANALNELDGIVLDLNGQIDVLKSTAAALQARTEYIRSYTDENDRPCLELGEGDSTYKAYITNEGIRLMDGTAAPTIVTRQMLVIEKTMVRKEIQIGDDEDTGISGVWILKRRANGNCGLMWKEVAN